MMGPGAKRYVVAAFFAVVVVVVVVLGAGRTEPPATEPVARGRQVYRALDCGSCHEPNLFGRRTGPPLDQVGGIAAERRPGSSAAEYLEESLDSPGAYLVAGYPDVMPRGLTRRLTAPDRDALIRYLLSLR